MGGDGECGVLRGGCEGGRQGGRGNGGYPAVAGAVAGLVEGSHCSLHTQGGHAVREGARPVACPVPNAQCPVPSARGWGSPGHPGSRRVRAARRHPQALQPCWEGHATMRGRGAWREEKRRWAGMREIDHTVVHRRGRAHRGGISGGSHDGRRKRPAGVPLHGMHMTLTCTGFRQTASSVGLCVDCNRMQRSRTGQEEASTPYSLRL